MVDHGVEQFDNRSHSVGFEKRHRGLQSRDAIRHLNFARNSRQTVAGKDFKARAIDGAPGVDADAQLFHEPFAVVRRNQAASGRVDVRFLIDHENSCAEAELFEQYFILGEERGVRQSKLSQVSKPSFGDALQAFANRHVAEIAGGYRESQTIHATIPRPGPLSAAVLNIPC